ncbi:MULTISPECIES: hypothetical protein [Cyanophyceae]|uniref:FHA domain containing protein n=1 Tax=Leptolyngbya subtilissima DQ-A4 TaxID=2933933 RepID=A0ABV0JY64_9CYAN|nr:hypothetical protein [Nodosilinea sp. FACHB-141]MBD2112013.1 hypothetical protein [Nodosilinea sp. FACHB-141]
MGTTQGFIRKVMGLGRRVVALCAIALLTFGLASCAKPVQPTELLSEPTPQSNRLTGQIAEVSPPETLETLKQIIDAYTPQVRILSPRPGEVLDDTSVSVRLQVRGLPLFKDDTYELGPHLHLFLDNEPYKAVYDLSEPVTFDGLSPGTHTLRVFASRPWHESFKNQGAFDQRTFHIVAPTPQNELNAKAPLLTYSRPQATYGAEPIMLDFYLTNAPLHMSAQTEADDDLHDWRIRCTVNDQSFVFDQWQPIWLKGFKPGRNWVQLELIDESGNPIDNRFNNTVRIIDYQPGASDTLSRLVRGELSLKDVAGIIDPTYVPPAPPAPEPTIETPEPEPQPPSAEIETPEQNLPEPETTQPEIAAPEPSQSEAQEQPAPELTAPDTATQGLPPAEPEDETPPTPLVSPEKSIESEAAKEDQLMLEDDSTGKDAEEDSLEFERPAEEAPASIAPESKDAIEDMVPPTDLGIPPVLSPQVEPEPVPVLPTPPAISEPTPEPSPKGLLNRFKQWRNPANSPPAPANPAPDTPEDTFDQLPQATPVPDGLSNPEADAAPELPSEPTAPSTGEEQAEPSPPSTEKAPEADSPEAETDEPTKLPRTEQPKVAPRSPLAPEVRPFI